MVNFLFLSVLALWTGTKVSEALPVSDAEVLAALRERAPSLVDCLTSKNVPISLISSPNYAQLAKPYNLALPYKPAAITLPTTTQHVSDSVVCAASSNTKVQAKSGGHSYASFSSGGKDGSLVVDLEGFQEITVDGSTNIAKVGGGVRLGNLAEGIFKQGGRALPHGTCPGVGIGGHFTHGGYGHDSRLWGLALDTIVGLDVVLANGSYVHATETDYSDIYYALRGAADSFGVITTFYLQTRAAPAETVVFSISIPDVLSSAQNAANSFLALQTFALDASIVDRKLSFGVYLDGSSFNIGGMYFDTADKFNNDIKPAMLKGLPAPSTSSVQSLDWLAALTNLAGGPLTTPTTGYDAHDTFLAKSIVTQESCPLTQAALESFFAYILTEGRNSPSPWFSIINLNGGPDSQINAKSLDFSSYSHRSSLWTFQNYGYTANNQPPFTDSIKNFVIGLSNSLTSAQPEGVFDAYLNYVDPTLSPQEAHAGYYGDAVYAKLLAIKQQVDPDSVFWNPQAIGT
ncbi:MAG: hypothetical protein M1835_005250 [Candelina submexicana]|nr:MAG: hypothetical protein M1835_005250 [Candelina submexicana]